MRRGRTENVNVTLYSQLADRLRFALAWTVFSAALRYRALAKRSFIVPPAGPQAARHITLVGRLPSQITGQVNEVVASLAGPVAHHYVYPADTIHITIQNLDELREVDGLDRVLERLSILVGSFPPIMMKAAGLGVSPDSVFVQIFPMDESLADLRRGIRALIRASCQPSPLKPTHNFHRSRQLFRNMVFANVMRSSGIVPPSLVRKIKRHRFRYFGTFALETVELVVTDRLLSADGTQVKERISLRGLPRADLAAG